MIPKEYSHYSIISLKLSSNLIIYFVMINKYRSLKKRLKFNYASSLLASAKELS